ncbi:tripartite motif-containing protein 16-like, partial [Silurus asotus]
EMAEARVSVNLDEFNCSICLDLLADPVSVPCGHSFCKSCINRQWDGEVLNRVYSCPLCKQHFSPRPILGRNIMLAEMVEKLKKTRVSERTLAGPDDVECDVCIGNKHKAVKSCLVCVASYCQVHFEMHNELNPENTHKSIESRYSLKDRICSVHKKLKDFICYNEEQFYCPECVLQSCADHSTTTVTNKRNQEQFQIEHLQSDVLHRTKLAENSIKDLKKAVNTIKTSAKTTLDQTEKMFAELIRSAERKRSEIRGIIKATEEAEVHRAEKILHFLEQEVTELKERDKKLVQLSNLEDDFLFVKTSMSRFNLATFSDAPQFTINLTPFKEIQNSVSELEKKCKEFCISALSRGSRAVHLCAPSSTPIRHPMILLLLKIRVHHCHFHPFSKIYHHLPFHIPLLKTIPTITSSSPLFPSPTCPLKSAPLNNLSFPGSPSTTSSNSLQNFSFSSISQPTSPSLPLPVIVPTFKVPTRTSTLLHVSFPCRLCRCLSFLLLLLTNSSPISTDFRQLTVNPRMVHEYLQLSEGNRKITYDASNPNYNRESEIFSTFAEALCREALQERCYWEVEWGGQQVYIAMSYIGVFEIYSCDTAHFGFNDKSWSLRCNSSQFTFFHDSCKKVISGPLSRRIGIYLDHRAGTLSFYSITDTMKLLHRVSTFFTEPLYGGFWVFNDSSVKL